MLTYYLAQYLLPAFWGKLFDSFRISEIVNYIWAEIGLILIFLNLIRIINIYRSWMQIISSVVLCFFSGPLILAQKSFKLIYPELGSGGATSHFFCNIGDIILQYTSNYAMLRWVMPQVLVIWLITLLFIENMDLIEDYIVLLLPCILYGTLSFIGLSLIATCVAVVNLIEYKSIKRWIKKVFSPPNILVLCSFGGILIFYFYGNVFSDKPNNSSFRLTNYEGRYGIYLIFCFTMVILYSICVWDNCRKRKLFYLSCASLLIIPLFRMGLWNDWVMRCSIPALFILMFYVIQFLNKYLKVKIFDDVSGGTLKIKLSVLGLLVLMFFGSIYPTLEFYNSIITNNILRLGNTISYGTLEKFANRTADTVNEALTYNYYSYDIENNLFYKYIARIKLSE